MANRYEGDTVKLGREGGEGFDMRRAMLFRLANGKVQNLVFLFFFFNLIKWGKNNIKKKYSYT